MYKRQVLGDSKIIANDIPEHLYKNPKTPLIASFFGEFNLIDDKIVYSHQLKMVEKSNLKAVVNHSYFKGYYYLIEANLNGEKVFFEHSKSIKKGVAVFLSVFL